MTPATVTIPQPDPDPTDVIVPDWADKETRAEAEIAASLSSDLADDLDDGDPYGVLDFDDHFEPFDSEDEAEMRRELAKSRLGRFFDGVVDVFLSFEDEIPDWESEGRSQRGSETTPRELEDGLQGESTTKSKSNDDLEPLAAEQVEAPPERPVGVWDDVKWFGRLVARTVRS
jgi:hypothetical protein